MKSLNKFLSSIFSVLLLVSYTFANDQLTQKEWTYVDQLVEKIPQGRYVDGQYVIRRESDKVYIGLVELENEKSFLIQEHTMYMCYFRESGHWALYKLYPESDQWYFARININLLVVFIQRHGWNDAVH